MKKIGLYLGLDPGLGAFQYSQSMLDGLASCHKSEFDSVVFYSSRAWESYLEGLDLKVHYVPKSLPSRIINRLLSSCPLPVSLWRKLARKIDPFSKAFINAQCDIWIFPAQDSWAYLIPVPALCAIHDLMHRYESHFPEVSENGMYRFRELHYKCMCRWAKGILVDSKLGKQHVQESYGMRADYIHVLPYSPPKYIYSADKPSDFDLRYSLPKKYIFYPAQFWEHKNHCALIQAVDKLKDKLPDIKLVFAGSKKNAYEACVNLVKQLQLQDRIIFLGYVPNGDMPELYRRARAMIMPTFFGPTNIPPLEAFVAGCPVAVSNIYGMPEQVGDAALLFDPKSDVEITKVIHQLWTGDELCAELVEKGKQHVQRYSIESFSKHLTVILKRSLSDIDA